MIYIPEMRDGSTPITRSERGAAMAWENEYLPRADCIFSWIPRDMQTMPGLTTNVEIGRHETSGRLILGVPPGSERNDYLRYHARKNGTPITSTLAGTARAAVQMLGAGAQRFRGERDVPLDIWQTPSFQQWYAAQQSAGNLLTRAKVAWTLRIGPKQHRHMFYWALHVKVLVTEELRRKSNEVVLSRPDIYTVLMYRRAPRSADTQVVLVREFRSRSATADGYVHELPGGSSFNGNSPLAQAGEEAVQETGLAISPERLQSHGARQMDASASSHRGHLFTVEITENELDFLRRQAGVPHGVARETERTYVEPPSVKFLTTPAWTGQRSVWSWQDLLKQSAQHTTPGGTKLSVPPG